MQPNKLERGTPGHARTLPTGAMRFEFANLTPDEWRAHLARVPRSNLLQSFAYGRAVRRHRQLMPRFALIRVGEVPVGLFQIQEARLLGLHVVVLDRGPLWFEERVPALWWRQFVDLYSATYPKRIGRFRRFMPELPDAEINARLIEQVGFRRARADLIGHRSLWIDLTADAEALRSRLKSNWRGALQKAEQSGLSLEIDETGRHLAWFLVTYAADKAERKYPGAQPAFLGTLAQGAFEEGQGFLMRAHSGHTPIAAVLLIGHGRAATYQAGWTSETGRSSSAHHLLLWRAALLLKERGYTGLDLGGINPEQAEGVTRFKTGLGGEAYQLLSIYR